MSFVNNKKTRCGGDEEVYNLLSSLEAEFQVAVYHHQLSCQWLMTLNLTLNPEPWTTWLTWLTCLKSLKSLSFWPYLEDVCPPCTVAKVPSECRPCPGFSLCGQGQTNGTSCEPLVANRRVGFRCFECGREMEIPIICKKCDAVIYWYRALYLVKVIRDKPKVCS